MAFVEVWVISLPFECAQTCAHMVGTVEILQPQVDIKTPTLKNLKVGGP